MPDPPEHGVSGVVHVKTEDETNNAFRRTASVSDVDQNSGSIDQSQPQPANLVSNGPSLRGTRLQGTMQPRRAVQPSLMQSAKQLDMEVLAVEAARQLEERFATAPSRQAP